MRVIAGKSRGRPLRSLRGMDVRPTADRLRETLFDVLTAGNPAALDGTVWVDLYAGTGAVGIEALSRGAGMVYFVESSRAAAELIRENLRSLGVESGYEILNTDVRRGLRTLQGRGVAADFVFLDPPYRLKEEYAGAMELLAKSEMVKPAAVVIAEHEKKFKLPEADGVVQRLEKYRLLEQGDAALS